MKSIVVWCVALGLGLAVGIGTTVVEFTVGRDEPPVDDLLIRTEPPPRVSDDDQPMAETTGPIAEVLGDDDYDFGTMERTGTMDHTFQIKNVGDEVLTLKTLSTTCKCTLSQLSKEAFQPGEIAEVVLEWTANTISRDPDFAQTATIQTNDPNNQKVELKIHGFVTEKLRALPTELALGSVPSSRGVTTEFRLFGSHGDEIRIMKWSCDNERLADFFELKFEPLDEEEVKNEKGVSCGLLAVLTVKPGLPLEPIRQTIRIKADVGEEVEIAVPVRGRVSGDILIPSTALYSASRNLLRLGVLGRNEGAEAKLFMFVKGENRKDVKISVGDVEPEGYFQVDIGPPEEINNGKTIKYLISIRVQPGLEPINRLGGERAEHGRIVFETTLPKSRLKPIGVEFAIK